MFYFTSIFTDELNNFFKDFWMRVGIIQRHFTPYHVQFKGKNSNRIFRGFLIPLNQGI